MTVAAMILLALTAVTGAAMSALAAARPAGGATPGSGNPGPGIPARPERAPSRRRSVWRALAPAVLLAAAASCAVGTPPQNGVLADVARVLAVLAATTGGSVCVAAAFALAHAGGARARDSPGAHGARDSPAPTGSRHCAAVWRSACSSARRSRCACSPGSGPGSQ
ncbi:hypothetical protein [Tsukamurella soli]|uniref:hypothetical protein n=1 Tax=Tsukamurella soli TaxID=644556 RepID=UPI003616498C